MIGRRSSVSVAPIVLALLLTFLGGAFVGAATPLVTSTFENGSDGWQPWSTSTVDGIAPGDPYLKLDSNGGEGNKSRLIAFNSSPEWTGDYVSAGVFQITLDVSNMSLADDLSLRVAVGNRASPMQEGGTWWVSQAAVAIELSSEWTRVSLSLLESDLRVVGNENGEIGTESYLETFSDIRNLRLMSSNLGRAAIGDAFIGPVAIDNVSLVVPEPSSLVLTGLGLILVTFPRRRA